MFRGDAMKALLVVALWFSLAWTFANLAALGLRSWQAAPIGNPDLAVLEAGPQSVVATDAAAPTSER